LPGAVSYPTSCPGQQPVGGAAGHQDSLLALGV